MAPPNFDHLKIDSTPERRSEAEDYWVSFQPYLLSKGYQLRPRYRPDWVPSWTDTKLDPTTCEDSLDRMPRRVIDATRITDEKQVIIKILAPTAQDEGKDEHAVILHFSTPPLKDDPSNHIIPLVDYFPIPGMDVGYFLVMPLLSAYDGCAPFYNLAEIHEFMRQIFEGVAFMHNNNVAHCDIASPNILMDAHQLFEEPFHPYFQSLSVDIKRRVYPKYKRSQKEVRYYLIDLGYAKFFRDLTTPREAIGMYAREAAPEQAGIHPYDPFAVDVYQLGAMIKQDLIPNIQELHFLSPLIETLVQRDPYKRPKIEVAQASINTAFLGLSGWRYRWPLVSKDDSFVARWRAFFNGLAAELKYIIKRVLKIILGGQ